MFQEDGPPSRTADPSQVGTSRGMAPPGEVSFGVRPYTHHGSRDPAAGAGSLGKPVCVVGWNEETYKRDV